jgi:hypothetical protein
MTTTTTTTTPTKKITAFGDDSLLFSLIIKAISENIGTGTEYNNNLIDDPGATHKDCNYNTTFVPTIKTLSAVSS